MKSLTDLRSISFLKLNVTVSCLALAALIFTSCSLIIGDDEDLENTQTAVSAQQTENSKKTTDDSATLEAQRATLDAEQTLMAIPPTPDMAATQVAISVQETMAASAAAPVTPPPGSSPPPPPPPADLDSRIQSANVLLFEDIVNDPSYYRFVQRTLDSMGMQNVKDDGSAKGWLKSDLLGTSPTGQPWDLVILAIEVRGEVSGEFFEYLDNVLNQGTSVIIEAWHLDEINLGAIKPILSRCGVDVYPYFPKTGTSIDLIMYPLGIPHPVLSEPNSGLTFTNVVDTWMWSFDLGSLMHLTGTGDAQLLLGTNAQEQAYDGGLAVCMGGQLTLQTFSSHSFTLDTMMRLWENYINNALKVRFSSAP